MKLDRQRTRDAAGSAVGFFVGAGFVSWLVDNPFSRDDFPKYAVYIVGAAVAGYLGLPAWIQSKVR